MSEPQHNPTPAEIRRECERIQEGWSEIEREHRRGRRHGNCKDGSVEIQEARFGDGVGEPKGD